MAITDVAYSAGSIQAGRSASTLGGAPRPPTQMQEHASRLQEQANRLASLNVRLSEIIDRFAGPAPPTAGENVKDAQPVGVLVVAQFESRRIAEGLDRLTDQLNRLEQIA